jgi:hypothetical protein
MARIVVFWLDGFFWLAGKVSFDPMFVQCLFYIEAGARLLFGGWWLDFGW